MKKSAAQLDLPLDDPEDWVWLETHVVDGRFCPPLKEGSATEGGRRGPRPAPVAPLVLPSSRLRWDARTSTWRTTYQRIRAVTYAPISLVVVRDEETGEEVEFEIRSVSRAASDWRSLTYRAAGRDERLVVVNADAAGEDEAPPALRVVAHATYWVAENVLGDRARRDVERAGFRFDPAERQWVTLDPCAAAAFDPALRASLRRQREELERASAQRVPRNVRYRDFRRK